MSASAPQFLPPPPPPGGYRPPASPGVKIVVGGIGLVVAIASLLAVGFVVLVLAALAMSPAPGC